MSMQLERQIGPDCPRCGCNACELIDAGTRFGRPWARYRCDNDGCDHVFNVGAPSPPVDKEVNGVAYVPVRCPKCRSKDTEITRGPAGGLIRRHRCRSCGQAFKSVEK